jgi:glycosyltransferase involved in cell wall biosynthesis
MAEAIRSYVRDPDKLVEHGQAGRQRTEADFSIESMVNGYLVVYDAVLERRRRR